MIEATVRLIERAFRWCFRRTALRHSGVYGQGEVIRRGTGERIPFTIRGDVVDGVLEQAMSRVAGKLYGMAGPFWRMRGAVTHPTSVRNAVADLVVDLIDAGAGAGTIEFQTSGQVEVATLTHSDPAYGNAAAGTATANAITSDTNATGGTVAESHHFDSDSNEVFATNVQTSGGDINLSSLAVGSGDTVSMSSLTYSAPA